MSNQKNTPLRFGYTTGTCAAAAAKAALLLLVDHMNHDHQSSRDSITVSLPRGGHYGDTARLPIHRRGMQGEGSFSEIIKDGGDDPDVTHGAVIRADVSWSDDSAGQGNSKDEIFNIEILGGMGVGRVTRTGLPVPVGEPAINPVPRKMIVHEISEVLRQYGIQRNVKVIISVPDGERIARLTMNARLGITGGISILGTRGVVVPFSSAAYRSSLAVTIKAAAENGLQHLVLTTGGRSEKYAMELYPELEPMSFIEAGEFIGFSLKKCQSNEILKVTLSGMIGKLSKVASGVLMVHSSKSSIDFDFLARCAEEAGADTELVEKIKKANTASEVGDWMNSQGLVGFFDILTSRCCEVCFSKVQGTLLVETVLFNMDGELLSRKSISIN